MARQKGKTATATAGVALPAPAIQLTRDDMPEAATTASERSVNARDWYQRAVSAEQILLVIAAAAGLWLGLIGSDALAQGVVVGALGGAFVVRALRTAIKPELQWYSFRSTSEDVQSQAWRYVMGVAPYDAPPSSDPLKTPEAAFVERCQEVWNKSTLPAWQDGQSEHQITRKMTEVHGLSLPDRIGVYIWCRLIDQRDWYRMRANQYRGAARAWNAVILILEGAAGLATAARFFGLPAIDLYGIATTAVAGIAVWTHMKQYTTLEQRYMRMARTLQSYIDVLTVGMTPDQVSPDGWSAFVNRVEQLMEQEHESWLNLYKGLADSQQPQLNWQEFEQQLAQAGVKLR